MLIHRYIKSYGPVTLKDIYWWLGANNSQVKKVLDNLGGKINNINISDLELEYMICKEEIKKLTESNLHKQNIKNLLTRLDPYLMGYKDRERYVPSEDYEFIFDRSGNATSTILFNGRVIGIWDVIEKPNPTLKVFLFGEIDEIIMNKINIEGKKIGKFITNQVSPIKICDEMTPLTKRTMGVFMSPLKDCN